MSEATFTWRGRPVPFRPGESIAAALLHAGISDLGSDAAGGQLRYFCGIGACQNCLVRVDGRTVESCLAPARPGASVTAMED